MSYAEIIERILRKLSEVRERHIESFGSKKHRFDLTPPLAEADVVAFERAQGIVLPADFRAFITSAGESGAGPYYGLLPLADYDDLAGSPRAADWLSSPCQFVPEMPRTDAAYAAAVQSSTQPFQGAIALVDQGCTYYAMLVVSGEARGRVMYVNHDGGVPFFVENTDFLSWYERWLDELLWGHQHVWFGTGMAGDEATLVRRAWDEPPRRLDALHAMHRLPRVVESTAEAIAMYVRDEDAGVRAAALGLVAKFKLLGLDDCLHRALDDEDGAVRLAALAALIAVDAAWIEEARRALEDLDTNVRTRALRELSKAKALSEDEALRLLDAPDAGVAGEALSALQSMGSSRVVAALLLRVRAGTKPDALGALLTLIHLDVATPGQRNQALDLLLQRFNAAEESRTALVRGIGAFAKTHEKALQALLEATRHSDAFVRFDAAFMLGDVADGEAVEALTALSYDETMPKAGSRGTVWSVGESARKALAKIDARARAKVEGKP